MWLFFVLLIHLFINRHKIVSTLSFFFFKKTFYFLAIMNAVIGSFICLCFCIKCSPPPPSPKYVLAYKAQSLIWYSVTLASMRNWDYGCEQQPWLSFRSPCLTFWENAMLSLYKCPLSPYNRAWRCHFSHVSHRTLSSWLQPSKLGIKWYLRILVLIFLM